MWEADAQLARTEMKTTAKRLLMGIMAICCCSIGNGQIIYSNSFTGEGVTINGTAPTVANSLLGGTNNALWICTYTNNVPAPTNGTVLANGTIATNPGCALLPFMPQSGAIYYLTASLTVPAGMPNWVAMGFTQLATQTNNATGTFSRFTDNPPGGYAWMAVRTGTAQGAYGGRGTANPFGSADDNPVAGTYILEIILNTLDAKWTTSAYENGVQIGTNFVYATNPTLGFAGIGQTSFFGQSIAGIQWNYVTLSAVAPPIFIQQPASGTVSVAAGATLTIPATLTGTPPLGYSWTDVSAGTNMTAGTTNNVPLNATLTVPNVPSTWNGKQLELTVTNAYGSTNINLTLNVISPYTATVNPGSVLVTNFQGWGTSLQWWANVIGSYPNRTNYINLIFDTLKLNVVRYEIGAGQNPAVNNPNTPYKAMMQGFELTNGLWNWNADLNQRWVLQQAEANGANLVEAFAVSPPWWMCVSSNVDGNMAGTNNLQLDCETNFAIYLATVVSNLTVLDGDQFNSVIPMNEPSLGTVGQETNGYETCHVSNDQQQRVIADLRTQLNADAPSVGIDAPGDYDEYEAYVDLTEYSSTTLGDLALFSTHSYIQNDPANLAAEAVSQKKPLWVAEYGDSDSTGLTMAQHIHDDITGMNLSAWVYWMAVNSDAGNAFLYNGLVAPTNSGYSTSYVTYEKFYAMGQFSEFIRPGCKIISVNDGYTLAAWNPTNSTLVLVTVNTNTTSTGVTYNLSEFGSLPWQISVTQTAPGENMATLPAPTVNGEAFVSTIPADSITTFVLTTNSIPIIVNQSPPPNQSSVNLYAGQTPTFSVSATGTPPLYYEWLNNGVAITGATNTAYTLAAGVPGSTNSYECIVSNAFGSATSMVWSVSVVPSPTASYPMALLSLNPIGFWPLNEAEQGSGDDGVVAEDYAGGNNGIYTNVLLGQPTYDTLTDPTATSAKFGYISASNSCAYGILGPDFSLPNGSNAEFTISAWANSTGPNGVNTPTIAAKGYYYQEEYALDAGAPNSSFRFSVRDAAGAAFNANSTISLTNSGQWYHLVGVCDEANGLVQLYTNGSLAASVVIPTASGITNSSGTPMTIGARSSYPADGFDQQFPGCVSDVAIYNYALNSGQVQTLYQAGVSLPSAGLTFTNMNGNSAALNWNYGVLQTATNVAGPYNDLTNATPPYTMPFTNGQQFFRIREN
jgi:O-glycosyl hydrolase